MDNRREPSNPAARTTLSILHSLLENYHPRNFAVKLWDGSILEPESGQRARFTLILRTPGILRKMFLSRQEAPLAEAYIYDDLDVEGDLEGVFPFADHLLGVPLAWRDRFRLGSKLSRLPSSTPRRFGRQPARLHGALHSIERDRLAVTYHYDTSNEFFALYLDRGMVYSCAYFTHAEQDLDSAQQQKLDYVCRKLQLRKGDRLLDIGCGWGALILHAAKAYGVSALGITLSEQQAKLANERIRDEGLADRCRAEVRDYRQVPGAGEFDKIVSIGMVEHVGESLLPEYFRQAWNLLRPGGLFLNHGIAYESNPDGGSPLSFSQSYVFPDGDPVPLHVSTRAAERAGFEVRDVESLREHYALTLREWVRRLEAHHEEAVRATDEATYRVWRLFMAGSAYRFAGGRYNVYQSLLVKQDQGRSGLPLTRAAWYA